MSTPSYWIKSARSGDTPESGCAPATVRSRDTQRGGGDGSRVGDRAGGRAGTARRGVERRARRAAGGGAGGDRGRHGRGAGRADGRRGSGVGDRPVRGDARRVGAGGPAGQQRGHVRPGRRGRRDPDRRVVVDGRGQPHGRVSVRAGSHPDDEGADAARRAHHQQRVDFGVRAAAEFGALHRDQARDHGTDEIDLAGRAGLGHRLRPDRYRQRSDTLDRAHVRGRTAGGRQHRAGTAHRRAARGGGGGLHGQPAARRQRPVPDRDGDEDAVYRAAVDDPL